MTGLSQTLQGTDLSSSAAAMNQLKTSVSALATGADQALPGAQQAISTLSGGLQSVQSAVNAQLIPGSQTLEAGLDQLANGSSTLEAGVSQYTGIQSDRRLADTGLQRRCTGRRCFFAE